MGEYLYYTIEEIQKGNRKKIINIITKFNPLIKSLSRRLQYEESETDLIICLIETIGSIDLHNFDYSNEGPIISYIKNVMHNKSIDLFRKNIVRKKEEVEINYDILADKSNYDIETNIFIKDLFNILSELQNKVLCEKFIKDNTDIEIAKKLNITRQAVNKAKNRAIKKLREHLLVN